MKTPMLRSTLASEAILMFSAEIETFSLSTEQWKAKVIEKYSEFQNALSNFEAGKRILNVNWTNRHDNWFNFKSINFTLDD